MTNIKVTAADRPTLILDSKIFGVLTLKSATNKIYHHTIGDLVSKETVCCVGGKVKH